MSNWLRRVRGAIDMGFAWAVTPAFVGVLGASGTLAPATLAKRPALPSGQ